MNPFQMIPEAVRQKVYLIFALVTLVPLVVAGYCGATGDGVPTWAIGLGGALVPIGSFIGFTAASNTPTGPPKNDAGHADLVEICIVSLCLVLFTLPLIWLTTQALT